MKDEPDLSPNAPLNSGGPRFSVIVSTFRRPGFLAPLILSILAQERPPFEVIVVEGGSTTDLAATHAALADWSDRIRILHVENCSLGASRNHGARAAQGDWCAFSDDDDIWSPSKLSALAGVVGQCGVSSHAYHSSPNPEVAQFGRLATNGQSLNRSASSLCLHFLGNRYGGGSSLSARKDVCTAIPFDESMRSCEDIDWILRCMFAGISMSFIETPLVIYRQHGARMTGSQHKVALWEFRMIVKFAYIPFGLLGGFAAKFLRIAVRMVFRR